MNPKKTAVEFKYGQMAQDMMDFGEMEWLMVMAASSTQKETSMKESGQKIKLMGMEYTHISVVVDMKVNGLRISNMDLELNNGLMAPNMTDNMSKV